MSSNNSFKEGTYKVLTYKSYVRVCVCVCVRERERVGREINIRNKYSLNIIWQYKTKLQNLDK